ncbi:uncharacterized protein [Henckelia pumila]|uniref:uncharacterized protein n=1 Tax=Henckelia pumila TaxID=405737 RepID=UPI003C6E4432
MGHSTEMCPTLQEEIVEQVNATGGFPGSPQRNYYPYSYTYNPGWRDYPNLRYVITAVNHPPPQVQPNNLAYRPPYPPQPQRPQISTPGEFLENIVKDFATNTLNFQHETKAMPDPKDNVSEITLRSGKELKVREEVVQAPVKNEDDKESKVEEDEIVQKDTPKVLKESRKDEGIKELYDTFCRCEGCHKIELGEQVSAVIQKNIPAKCKDPGPLKETAIVIQMIDRSTIYPRGLLEDVLVKVDNLVFPADFYVASKTEPKLPPDRSKRIPMG